MQDKSLRLLENSAFEGRKLLLEQEAYDLLEIEGLRVPKNVLFRSSGDVTERSLADFPGEKVILKLASRIVTHKTEVGGVKIVSKTVADVSQAVDFMFAAVTENYGKEAIDGVMAAELVRFEKLLANELLAGFRLDAAFGPVVSLGIGGLHTEFFHDHLKPASSLRSCSAFSPSLDHLLKGSFGEHPLKGQLRGQTEAPIRMSELEEFISNLSRLAVEAYRTAEGSPRLCELEINPVVVDTNGKLVILDALARIESTPAPKISRPISKIGQLLRPQSALVVGASAKALNSGRIILRNLLAGGGISRDRIYCLHPKAKEIDTAVCYPRIEDLPEKVDMTVIAIPATQGADRIVVDLVEKGATSSITLIPGGFAETKDGKEREAILRSSVAQSHKKDDGGVILNGGNCLGIVSKPGGYNTFFLPKYKLPFRPGKGDNLASISQSGAYLVTQASNLDGIVSPRYSISVGNQADLTIGDYLAYLKDEEGLDVFSVYVEGFQPDDGLQFLSASREIAENGKAVLLYKAGRSPEGAAAASSHTASMVGDYDTAKALSEQAGVVVCESFDEFQDLGLTFCLLWSKAVPGNRVGIVTNAGFEATAAADRLEELKLAELTHETLQKLGKTLPEDVIDPHNPLDATPVTNTERFAHCVNLMADDPGVDCLVVSPVPPTPALNNLPPSEEHKEDIHSPNSLPSLLLDIYKTYEKPVVFCVDAGPLYDPMVKILQEAGAPCFRHIDRAMHALSTFVSVKTRERMS